ncbi:hypothetical protein AB1E18_009448 [Capra hircus]
MRGPSRKKGDSGRGASEGVTTGGAEEGTPGEVRPWGGGGGASWVQGWGDLAASGVETRLDAWSRTPSPAPELHPIDGFLRVRPPQRAGGQQRAFLSPPLRSFLVVGARPFSGGCGCERVRWRPPPGWEGKLKHGPLWKEVLAMAAGATKQRRQRTARLLHRRASGPTVSASLANRVEALGPFPPPAGTTERWSAEGAGERADGRKGFAPARGLWSRGVLHIRPPAAWGLSRSFPAGSSFRGAWACPGRSGRFPEPTPRKE